MLLSVQQFEIPQILLARRLWTISTNGLWVHVVRQRGMGADEDIAAGLGFGRPPDARNLVGVALRGRAFVRQGLGGDTAHECAAGDAIVMPGRGSFRAGILASDEESFSINIEIDRSTYEQAPNAPTFMKVRDLPRVTNDVELLVRAIENEWRNPEAGPLARKHLETLLATLSYEGLPVPRVLPRSQTNDDRNMRRMARAIDQTLSLSRSMPMLVDVENLTERSIRTVQRKFPELCSVWGQRAESFRAHRQRTQLARAVGAMSNPRATTELVSRALGFSSPNAFCRAMNSNGLPSPGSIARLFSARS